MSATSGGYTPGFQWPGGDGGGVIRGIALSNPVGGANFAGSEAPPAPNRGIEPRGIALSNPVAGAQFGPTTGQDWYGGQWDGPVTDSVDSLLDTDGFALVLARRQGSERIAFSAAGPPNRGIKTLDWTEEANAMVSWSATVPVDQSLYNWPFEKVIIGFNGERRLHATLIDISAGEFGDGELELSGLGPLFWACHGDISVSYQDMPAHRALEDIWQRAASATDGRVRGIVVTPSASHRENHRIPPEGVEWNGTPLEVLKQAHGYAGMAFAADHGEQATVFESFVPSEELRPAGWRPKDITPSISPDGYHNRVTVIGAERPGISGNYSATVSAPQSEIGSVMNGQIHARTERIPELTSDAACRARASTLLAEDRGEYTIGGSLTITPDVRDLVAGYTYRVSEFDMAAPAYFTPVFATLRAVSYSFGQGEANVSLEFEDESGLLQHIRGDLLPDGAPRSLARREQQLIAASRPDIPDKWTRVFGEGIWGTAAFGVTDTIADNNPHP